MRPALCVDELHPPPALLERVSRQAELATCALSSAAQAGMRVIWQEREYHSSVTAVDFERHCETLLARVARPIQQALRDARLRTSELDEIVLMGGATRMPIIRRLVTKLFGRFPYVEINPEEAIVQGAAIQAALKQRDQALKDVVMTDVCPYSMGVEVAKRIDVGKFEDGSLEWNSGLDGHPDARALQGESSRRCIRRDEHRGTASRTVRTVGAARASAQLRYADASQSLQDTGGATTTGRQSSAGWPQAAGPGFESDRRCDAGRMRR